MKCPCTKKRNPVALPSSLVGIGQFIELQGVTGDGEEFILKPEPRQRLWLAWRGTADNGDMLIVDVVGREAAAANEATTRLHKKFHAADPVNWNRVVWTPPTSAIKRLGYARTLTYRVPSRTPSNKNDADYIHAFGDFGGGVDMREEREYWPGIGQGPDGSVYIIRRSKNKYRLADWLEG